MLLSIKEMEVRELPFDEIRQPGEIDFSDSLTTQIGPLTARGVAELLENTGGEVRIKGQVKADLEAVCDRCLGRALYHIDTPFDLFYQPAAVAASLDDEVAIDEGEAEIGFYEMPGLELEDILREQVLLQLPMQRVCSETCRGICPVCGGNRNEVDCHCERHLGDGHPPDDRWNALKSVHLEAQAPADAAPEIGRAHPSGRERRP